LLFLRIQSHSYFAPDHVAGHVVQEVIPKMMASYENSSETSTRTSILTALAAILEKRSSPSSSIGAPNAEIVPHLTKYKDSLLSLFISASKTTSTAEQALKCIHQLVSFLKLEQEELNFVIHNLTNVLLEAWKAGDDLAPETLAVLQTLSNISPSSVEDVALPPLFALLPDKPPREDDTGAQRNCVHALTVLEAVCIHPQLFSRLLVHLSTKVELLVPDGRTDDGAAGAYAHALLRTIFSALETKSVRGDVDIPRYMDRFIPRLYFLFLGALTKEDSGCAGSVSVLISDAADIIELIVASLNVE
jgi:DNA repair/transcription protein MET18/MMS19